MEVIEAFVCENANQNIQIYIDQNEKPWFNGLDVAKVLGIKNIHSSTITFDDTYKTIKTVKTEAGERKATFLSEYGLYALLMHSRKPCAVVFQKWVFKVIEQIRITGRYELEQRYESQLENLKLEVEKIKKESALTRHKTLIKAFANKNVVYFGYIETVDGKRFVKIGSTDCVRDRCGQHVANFGNFELFYVFEVENNRLFEEKLHDHEHMDALRYNAPINNKNYREVYLMDDKQRDRAVNIAIANQHTYRQLGRIQHNLELFRFYNKLDTVKECSKTEAVEVLEDFLGHYPVDKTVLEYDINQLIASFKKNRVSTRGDKIQVYNKDGTLKKTYWSIIEAERDHDIKPSRALIKQAIKNSYLHKDYRWMALDKCMPNDTVQDLPPLNEDKRRTIVSEMIAALDVKKIKIEELYINMKTAAEKYGTEITTIHCAIERGSKSNGHYWLKWSKVPDAMKEEYLKNHALPSKYIRKNAKPIDKFDAVTGKKLFTYASIRDVLLEHKISRAVLKQLAKGTNGGLHDIYIWKYAEVTG